MNNRGLCLYLQGCSESMYSYMLVMEGLVSLPVRDQATNWRDRVSHVPRLKTPCADMYRQLFRSSPVDDRGSEGRQMELT
jgi:hypothetical protein